MVNIFVTGPTTCTNFFIFYLRARAPIVRESYKFSGPFYEIKVRTPYTAPGSWDVSENKGSGRTYTLFGVFLVLTHLKGQLTYCASLCMAHACRW